MIGSTDYVPADAKIATLVPAQLTAQRGWRV
jgi:hypothetical protein